MLEVTEKMIPKAYTLVAASTIKYRRSLELFEKFKIETQLIHFDKKNFYLQQRFISSKDNFVTTIMFFKLAVLNTTPISILSEITKESNHINHSEFQLDCPEYLEMWINFLQKSSSNLKLRTNDVKSML